MKRLFHDPDRLDPKYMAGDNLMKMIFKNQSPSFGKIVPDMG